MGALLLAALQLLAIAPAESSSVQGHLEKHTIASKVFGEERTLFVWVPESYVAAGEQRYPLLLAFQGESLFDAAVASGGDEWAVDELLSRSPAGIPEFVVVGIVSAPHANREFATPGSRSDAQADELLQHVLQEVLPFVEDHWRIEKERSSRYLMGMGLSALTAVYGAWVHAEAFAGGMAFDLPDVDTREVTWQEEAPVGGRPWLWLEQQSSDRSRQSNSTLFAALQRQSDVTLVVAGARASQPSRLAAAFRATPLAVWQRQQSTAAPGTAP